MSGDYAEWPDFTRGFEPRGFGSAPARMRLCGVCAEVVWSCVEFKTFCGIYGKELDQFCWDTMFATTMMPNRRSRSRDDRTTMRGKARGKKQRSDGGSVDKTSIAMQECIRLARCREPKPCAKLRGSYTSRRTITGEKGVSL